MLLSKDVTSFMDSIWVHLTPWALTTQTENRNLFMSACVCCIGLCALWRENVGTYFICSHSSICQHQMLGTDEPWSLVPPGLSGCKLLCYKLDGSHYAQECKADDSPWLKRNDVSPSPDKFQQMNQNQQQNHVPAAVNIVSARAQRRKQILFAHESN